MRWATFERIDPTRPVPLMMPFYRHNRRSHWTIRAAMIAYDVLSFDKSPSNHKVLSRAETLRRFPQMSDDGLDGSAIFYDGQVVWSERLCAEVALQAGPGEGRALSPG